MATALKDICRFCGKIPSFSKELINDINMLNFVKDFVHVVIIEEDNLPTKMCLDCEEKLLSFQMFVLECSRVQDTLKKMVTDDTSFNYQVKLEDLVTNEPLDVKPQVKNELSVDDIVDSMMQDSLSEHSIGGDNQLEGDDQSDDDIPLILQTKKITKKKRLKKLAMSEEDTFRFKEVLKQQNLHIKDFVSLSCQPCQVSCTTWNKLRAHFAKIHKTTPLVYCMCGTPITSKTILYKHIADHKLESKRLKGDTDNEENPKYSNLNVNDFVSFDCVHCNKKCSSWYKLKYHSEKSHDTTPVVQCVCGFSVKSKSVLYKHISDHKNPDILSCDKCAKVTKSLAALEKHKLRHIPKSERIFKCNDCPKEFNTKEGLKSHSKSHIPITERKVFECEFCELKFTTRSSAASHRRVVHEKIKSYVCDLCGYSCGTSGELKQHRAIHSDDKPYVCRKCSKPFKTYSNLKTHMDTHEDTSYTCYVCNRVLNSRRTLKKHLLVHEEKCRHVCSYCNKAFKRRQTLKVHLYTHTGDKPLSCRWCDERFAYASTLRSHRLRCHPEKMSSNQTSTNYGYKNIFDEEFMKEENVYNKADVIVNAVDKDKAFI